jgi:hypothetical protein
MPPDQRRRSVSRPSVSVRLVLGDLWVGAFVKRERPSQWKGTRWTAYVCLLPCLPIRVCWIVWDADVRWEPRTRKLVARERTR